MHRYKTRRAKDLRLIQKLKKWQSSPGQFNVFQKNCALFVYRTLIDEGIDTSRGFIESAEGFSLKATWFLSPEKLAAARFEAPQTMSELIRDGLKGSPAASPADLVKRNISAPDSH